MLDRTAPPPIQPIQFIPFPKVNCHTLSKGVKLYCIQHGKQPIVELQVVFQGGYCFEQLPGVSLFTPKMMNEGTKSYSSAALSEQFDFYGVSLGIETGFETIRFSLSSLEKQVQQALPVLQEILVCPTFPEDEFNLMITRSKQAIQVDTRKSSYWARRLSGHLIWGKNHPYGRHIGEAELSPIELSQLIDYHKETFHTNNLTLIAVGHFDEDTLVRQCDNMVSQLPVWETNAVSAGLNPPEAEKPGVIYHPVPDTMQSTIRIALPLFKRNHPDYHTLRLANTLFGGFFGSRLMKNIREEKGYTYGIGSSLQCYKYNGMWIIQTETAHEYVSKTLTEIELETVRLQQELVPKAELEIAANYLLGRMLSNQETPFQISDLFLTQWVNSLSDEDWKEAYEIVRSITPEDIQQICQKYLNINEMRIVVSGIAGEN